MRDHDIVAPGDYLRKVDEAAALEVPYDRWLRFGDLLGWAIDDHRHRAGEYMPVVAMLGARVARAADELREFIAGPANPTRRPMVDFELLAARLEELRSAAVASVDPTAHTETNGGREHA